MSQTFEVFTNTNRVFQIKFDKVNPPKSYAKDSAESITETILKTPSDIDPDDRVIIDLVGIVNNFLFIIIGRIWFQNRDEETIDKLWKKTSKTLNLLDNSLSEWVQYLKKYDPAAVSVFGFEEDGKSRQLWIQLFKELYDRNFDREIKVNFDEMMKFLNVDEKKGTEDKLKKDFLEKIKRKICNIKNLWMYEVIKDHDEDAINCSEGISNNQTMSYHVPTCNEIVSLASDAYTSVYNMIEILTQCAKSQNKLKMDKLWNHPKKTLSFFNDSLLEWLPFFPKGEKHARSILGFETVGSGRQPWNTIFKKLYDTYVVCGYPHFLKDDLDQMRNCLLNNEIEGSNKNVLESFLQLIKKNVCNITNLFYVQPIEEVSKLSVYEINEDQDEEAIKLSDRISNYYILLSDVPVCSDILDLAENVCSIVKKKDSNFVAQNQIKNTFDETSEILNLLATNQEARSEIGFEDDDWIKILKKLNDRFLEGNTYFLKMDFKEMEECLYKNDITQEKKIKLSNEKVFEEFLIFINTKIRNIKMECGKVKTNHYVKSGKKKTKKSNISKMDVAKIQEFQ